jgi:hypothetical protein
MLILRIDRKALAMTTLYLKNYEAKIPSLPRALNSVAKGHKGISRHKKWVND